MRAERITAIRAKINAERALLSDLSKRIGDDLKKHLEPASEFLTDAEEWLAPPRVPCSETELANRFGSAVQYVREAIAHRERVEAHVQRFGPNARVVG